VPAPSAPRVLTASQPWRNAGRMASEVRFEPDLYRGTAGYYGRFRLATPTR
jgi:hypothetical protein